VDLRQVADSLLQRGYALAGTAYQDNGWAIEQGLADVRALTEHWVACTVGAGAPRGVADATVALRLAYEVTFGIPASRGTVGDVHEDLDFENRGTARGWPSRRVARPRWVGWSFSDWSSACPRRDHPTDRLLPPALAEPSYSDRRVGLHRHSARAKLLSPPSSGSSPASLRPPGRNADELLGEALVRASETERRLVESGFGDVHSIVVSPLAPTIVVGARRTVT
jgi:hypothetical protein